MKMMFVRFSNSRPSQKIDMFLKCDSSGEVALLQQHDTFFIMLTPRETINLAAFLQLDIDRYEREDLVDNILDSLGLRSVESRKIGDQITGQAGNSGSGGGCLSGGERRRLSVGKIIYIINGMHRIIGLNLL